MGGRYIAARWMRRAPSTPTSRMGLRSGEMMKAERVSLRQLADVHVLEEDHEEEEGILGAGEFGRREVVRQEVLEDEEAHNAHHARCHDGAFEHEAIEDRLGGWAGFALQYILISWFEGKGPILDSLRYEVEPEQLGGQEGEGGAVEDGQGDEDDLGSAG